MKSTLGLAVLIAFSLNFARADDAPADSPQSPATTEIDRLMEKKLRSLGLREASDVDQHVLEKLISDGLQPVPDDVQRLTIWIESSPIAGDDEKRLWKWIAAGPPDRSSVEAFTQPETSGEESPAATLLREHYRRLILQEFNAPSPPHQPD